MGKRQMSDALTNTISVYAKQAPVNDRTVLDKLESCRWVIPPSWEMPQSRNQWITRNTLSFHKPGASSPAGCFSSRSFSQGGKRLITRHLSLTATWELPVLTLGCFLNDAKVIWFPTKCVQRTICSRKSLLLDLEQLLQILRSGLILCVIHSLSYVRFPRVCYYT